MKNSLPEFSDEEIVQNLRKGPPKRVKQVEDYIYYSFKDVIRQFKRRYSLSNEILEELYNDAIMKVISKIKDGTVQALPNKKLKAYFARVYQSRLKDYFKSSKNNPNLLSWEEAFPNERIRTTIFELTIDIPKFGGEILDELSSESCIPMIKEVEFNHLSYEEAAILFQYDGIKSFESAYSRCRKNFFDLIISKIQE